MPNKVQATETKRAEKPVTRPSAAHAKTEEQLESTQQSSTAPIQPQDQIDPRSLTSGNVLQLQRTIGNRAVNQLLSGKRPRLVKQANPPAATLTPPVQRATQTRSAVVDGEAILAAATEQRPNHTDLPDGLKAGVESLSGISLDDVTVHYNSAQPAQLNALAYAQGNDIHIAPGQEQYLPHEAWHVIQQAQGRVTPTIQLKAGVPINDDQGLEHEADVMGAKAAQQAVNQDPVKPVVKGGFAASRGSRHASLGATVQRAPAPMADEEIRDLAGLHHIGKERQEAGEELTDEDIVEMKEGTYALTVMFPSSTNAPEERVQCNCFGWALGHDQDTGDKGSLFLWKKEHGGDENFTDPDSGDAKIILWGDKEGNNENEWDVLHASVLLTHAELLARSGKFKGLKVTKQQLTASGIPDPFWSSAGGSGVGIMVHPKDWYEGGDFGVALKGMKGPQ